MKTSVFQIRAENLQRAFSILVLIFTLSACANDKSIDGTKRDGENITITFSAYEGYRQAIEPLIDEFHRANPGISVQFTPNEGVNLAENQGEDAVYRTLASSADAVMVSGRSSAMGNSFLDLRTLIESDASFPMNDFWPGTLSACQDAEGRVSGIPVLLYFTGIFFDEKAYDAAKLPYPQPGWTWDDFRSDIAVLTQTRDGFTRYGYADRAFLSILKPSIGASLEQTKGEINAAALTADLQWYLDLARAGLIYPIGGIEAQGEVKNADDLWTAMFQNNRAPAMWYGRLLEPNPGGTGDESDVNSMSGLAISKFGIAPFPIAANGSDQNTTPITGECIAISAGSTHPAAAWEWVKFLSSHWLVPNETQASQWLRIPSRQSVADAAGFWNKLPEQARESVRYGLDHAWYPGLYRQAEVLIYEAIERAISGEADLISAFEQAGTQLETTPLSSGQQEGIIVATPEATEDNQSQPIVINFSPGSTTPVELSAVKTLVEQFNQEHTEEIVVKLTAKPAQTSNLGYFEKLSKSFDCYVVQVDAVGAAVSGAVMSLTPLLEAEDTTFRRDYDVTQLSAARFEGELYALPLVNQPPIMVYNADLLNRRGLQPPTSDWSFAEFQQQITAATRNPDGDESFGMLPDSQAVDVKSMLLAGRGAQWLGELSGLPTANFNSPEMVTSLLWLKDLYNTGVMFQPAGGEDWWASITNAVQAGQVAYWTVLAGQENSAYFDKNVPQFGIGIVPLPNISGSTYSFSHTIELGFHISNQSQYPGACWTLAKFLSEQTTGYNGIPARESVATSPEWEYSVGAVQAEIYRKALAQSRLSAGVIYPDILTLPLQSWLGQLEMDVRNGANAQQSAATAQQKADAYYSCLVITDWSSLRGTEIRERTTACAKQTDPSWN